MPKGSRRPKAQSKRASFGTRRDKPRRLSKRQLAKRAAIEARQNAKAKRPAGWRWTFEADRSRWRPLPDPIWMQYDGEHYAILLDAVRAEASTLGSALDSQSLKVDLAPAPRPMHHSHKIRVVSEENPEWYQSYFANHHERKRQRVAEALRAIAEGQKSPLQDHRYLMDLIRSRLFEGYDSGGVTVAPKFGPEVFRHKRAQAERLAEGGEEELWYEELARGFAEGINKVTGPATFEIDEPDFLRADEEQALGQLSETEQAGMISFDFSDFE